MGKTCQQRSNAKAGIEHKYIKTPDTICGMKSDPNVLNVPKELIPWSQEWGLGGARHTSGCVFVWKGVRLAK